MDKLEINQIIEEIQAITDSKTLHDKLITYHPYDLASIIKELDEETRHKIYHILTPLELADIFEYLDDETSVKFLAEMNIKEGANVLTNMEADDAADVLNEMEDTHKVEEYLHVMDKDEQEELKYLAKHDDSLAGSIMTTNFITINPEMDVRDAMKKLITEASESEVINPLFVCESNAHGINTLVGIMDMKELIIARTPNKIKDLMEPNFVYSTVDEEISQATKKMQDYDLNAMPVLDDGQMVGIITIDDALDEVVEDFVEDYGKMAGVTNDIDEKTSIFKNMVKRIPWLICLLIISLLISNITGQFEKVIVTITIFAFFQSMIFDMSGNVGTQSLAITVRSISRQELNTGKEIMKHLWKELRIISINALLLSTLAFITSFIFMLISPQEGIVEWLVSLVIALSMMLTLIITGLLGSLIPIILSKLKIDPAVASGPLITTLSDTISILVYFGLATLFMTLIQGGRF